MQLVAYGAQDIYLTGNPQITFFKVVYRRHTNFSMETIEQTINGTPSSGGSSTVTISRNGDLVFKVYVTSKDTTIAKNGSSLIQEVELEIGGQRIDRHYEEWMDIWNELSTPESKAIGLKAMQGDTGTVGTEVGMCQIPLQFWFCRNPGLALPLIALQYHEVKLKFTWSATAGVVSTAPKVMCDYIYLDTDERRRFAQVSHEYLIEQVQKQSATATTSTKLNFNHPVKELIWTSVATNSYGTAQLKLNGHDRFSAQEEEYFQLRQPFDYHTAIPAQNLPTNAFASARAGTTSYTNIATGSMLLHAATTDGLTMGTTLFSAVLSGSSGTTFVAGDDIADAGTTPTMFIAVGGMAAGGLTAKSVAIGDVHLVQISDQAASAATKSTLALVEAVYTDVLGAAALVDGTGVFVSSSGGAAAATGKFTATTLNLHANTIVIKYSTVVTTGTALAANDGLTILKVSDAGCRTSVMAKKINVYSFALKPEEHQPSGTCNFSRIDTAKLDTHVALTADDNIYAVNYNVLRIMSGMGGLAYSN